jgi:ABC-2 type transport system ATP-binding protein
VPLPDEPANGFDPPGIIEMRELMRRLRDGGTTLLVSSHRLAEVDQIADVGMSVVAGASFWHRDIHSLGALRLQWP